MNRDDVHIEFTDAQLMLIRGKVERTYTTDTPPAGALEGTYVSGAIAETGEEEQQRPRSPYQATVEDEAEEGALATSAPAGDEEVAKDASAADAPKKPVDAAKYWLTERSIGEFSRTFNFPTRVDQDNVTASFKDGILSVVVPKAAKHEPRRIAVL